MIKKSQENGIDLEDYFSDLAAIYTLPKTVKRTLGGLVKLLVSKRIGNLLQNAGQAEAVVSDADLAVIVE